MNKKKLIAIMSAAIVVCIMASLFFGFKLYAYGKDVEITYVNTSGVSMSVTTQKVEVCKKYTLKTPTDKSDKEREFLYWTTVKPGTGNTEKGKVNSTGLWLLSTRDITLYPVWGDANWSDHY